MATFPVKYYRETQAGAPPLSGTAGALIAVLDACLITGFNSHTLDSLTRSGDVATATVGTGHGYADGDILLLEGADQGEYNGEVKAVNVTATAFDFSVAGTPASPATGVITAKVAPVGGWSRPFGVGDVAVYRSGGDGGLVPHYFRVDDTGSTLARVVGYESMTDVDTGIGPMPTAVQAPGGAAWFKSSAAGAASRGWVVVADAGLFFAAVDRLDQGKYLLYSAGAFESWKLGDQYAAALVANATTAPTNDTALARMDGNNTAAWIARDHSQIGGAVTVSCYGSFLGGADLGRSGVDYPGVVDGGLYHAPIVYRQADGAPRGIVLGLHQPLQDRPLLHGDVVAGALDGSRDLLAVAAAVNSGEGRALFDVTGPWR